MNTQELVDRQKELTNGYIQSQCVSKKLQKEAEEIHHVKVQLEEEKVQEIDALKVAQTKLQHKGDKEINKLKKVQDRLIVEQAHLCTRCGKVEKSVDEACQYIFERTVELTMFDKAK